MAPLFSSHASDSSARIRDVFPLSLGRELPTVECASRSMLRRLRRSKGNMDWKSEGVISLNELAGFSDAIYSGEGSNLLQKDCLRRLSDLYGRVPGKPEGMDGPRALAELCKSSSHYTPTEPSVMARYSKELVSWPSIGAEGVPVTSCLDGDDRAFAVDWRHTMLRSDAERQEYLCSSDRIRPHLEPTLVRRPSVYGDFVNELYKRNMLTFRIGSDSLLGVFFVKKKNGRLRIILDTRDVNNLFRQPVSTRLPTPAAFSSLESEAGTPVWYSASDIQDCFYNYRVDPALSQFFSLPALEAKFVDGLCELLHIDGSTLVTPLLTVLPMGWGWSLHLAQLCHESLFRRSGGDPTDLIVDRKSSRRLADSGARMAIYVDNNMSLGQDKCSVQRTSIDLNGLLDRSGLPTHEKSGLTTQTDYVGLSFDGTSHEIRLSWDRVWRLRLALLHILDLNSISGRQLEQVIGHVTWSCLLRRECLSILNSTYSFMRAKCHRETRLWPSVRRELRQIASLLPLMVANTSLPWSSTVSVSDSSDYGFAVLERDFADHMDLAKSWGRQSERWRYDYEDSVHARAHALGDPTLLDPASFEPLLDAIPETKSCEFTELDKDFFDEADWRFVYSSKWAFHEDILKTEGLALLWAARHKLRRVSEVGKRHILLTDNLSLCLAATKGRSGSPHLKGVLQRLCSLALVTGSRFYVRWLPSELNPADRGSRAPGTGGLVRPTVSAPAGDDGEASTPAAGPCPGAGTEATAADRLSANSFPGDPAHAHAAVFDRRVDATAAGCGGPSDAPSIPRVLGRGSPLSYRAAAQSAALHRCGPRTGPVFSVPGGEGSVASYRIEDPCGDATFFPYAGTFYENCIPWQLSGPPGLAAPHACTEQTSAPVCGIGCHPHRPPGEWEYPHCCHAAHGVQRLPPSNGTHIAASTPTCRPAGAISELCVVDAPDRSECRLQNGLLRRDGRVGQSLRSVPGPLLAEASRGRPAAASVERVPASRHQAHRSHDCRAGPRPHLPRPLPAATRRREPRHRLSAARPASRPEPRQVGHAEEPASLSEGGPRAADAPTAASCRAPADRLRGEGESPASPVSLPGRGLSPPEPLRADRVRSHDFSPAPSAGNIRRRLNSLLRDALKAARIQSGVFLDLFSGTGAVGKAWRSLGHAVISFDTNLDPFLFDLTSPIVLKVVLGWIRSNYVLGIHCGTPCTTWSIACKPAVRSKSQIFGFSTVPAHRLAGLLLGNRTMRSTARIIEHARKLGVPISLENP